MNTIIAAHFYLGTNSVRHNARDPVVVCLALAKRCSIILWVRPVSRLSLLSAPVIGTWDPPGPPRTRHWALEWSQIIGTSPRNILRVLVPDILWVLPAFLVCLMVGFVIQLFRFFPTNSLYYFNAPEWICWCGVQILWWLVQKLTEVSGWFRAGGKACYDTNSFCAWGNCCLEENTGVVTTVCVRTASFVWGVKGILQRDVSTLCV
jgi:hypothetical protein